MVRRAVGDLVVWPVDQVPCEAVAKEDQDECEQRRHRSEERHPRLAVAVAQVHQPWPTARRLCDLGALLRPMPGRQK
eukprot:scaffold99192_cov36-Phaeocystis_antarctica.AAC.2